MAATKKALAAREAKGNSAQPEYASKKEVKDLSDSVSRILDILEKGVTAPAAPVVPEPADIASVSVVESTKAAPNKVTTNPEWEATARELLGEALDHTEVEHERSGGIKFTIVVDRRYSNASAAYLEMAKTDRRTKEVSHEGMQGVEEWCRQVKANLARTQKIGAPLRA